MAASDNKRELPSFVIAGAAFPIEYDAAFYFAIGPVQTLKLFCDQFRMLREAFNVDKP